jgi:hypothetical protein
LAACAVNGSRRSRGPARGEPLPSHETTEDRQDACHGDHEGLRRHLSELLLSDLLRIRAGSGYNRFAREIARLQPGRGRYRSTGRPRHRGECRIPTHSGRSPTPAARRTARKRQALHSSCTLASHPSHSRRQTSSPSHNRSLERADPPAKRLSPRFHRGSTWPAKSRRGAMDFQLAPSTRGEEQERWRRARARIWRTLRTALGKSGRSWAQSGRSRVVEEHN